MKKKIGITAAVILGILAVCYIGFAVFFQSHFCFGTTIDGIKVGGCSTVKVEQLIEEEIGGYELTLVEREDQTETITASQIGAAPVFHGEIEELLADQNAFAWPVILFGKSALELEKTVAFDDTKFSGTIEALSCMQEENQRKPVDASCSGYSKHFCYLLHSVHAEAARQQKAPQKQLASPAKQKPVILFQKEHQYQVAALCMA